MNKIFFVVIISLMFSFAFALPAEWDFFAYDLKEDKKPVTVILKNDKLVLPDGKNISAKKIKSKNNCFDFEKLAEGKNHAVLKTVFNCEKSRKTYLGIGGLAFAVELNGKMIYDFRRKGLGNDYDPVSVNDHIIKFSIGNIMHAPTIINIILLILFFFTLSPTFLSLMEYYFLLDYNK